MLGQLPEEPRQRVGRGVVSREKECSRERVKENVWIAKRGLWTLPNLVDDLAV
jgi:hypothetical protein